MWHLAQLNVARPLAPLDSPQLAQFVAQLDGINALADAAPGFVWRLADATEVRTDDPSLIVNMSVWTSPEALFDFVYKSQHVRVMARRREWFERMEVFQVLWWIRADHTPTVEEAMERLQLLRDRGPSAEAFTFKQRYSSPDRRNEPTDMKPEPYCIR
jgi:hypothetical protein